MNETRLEAHSNPLIRFIAGNPHCEKGVCTTCGGFLIFLAKLSDFIKHNQDNLFDQLMACDPADFTRLSTWKRDFAYILRNHVSADQRRAVLNRWLMASNSGEEFIIFIKQNYPDHAEGAPDADEHQT